jgi:hypothetical protein
MALKPLNSVAGFSTGANANVAIDANSNFTASTLAVTGLSNLNDVANVKIGGGAAGQILKTDGAGNLSWASTGPSTAEYILYVSVNGSDSNDGSFNSPFLTIKAALEAAYTISDMGNLNVAVHVAPGLYTENMPLTITPNVSLIGDNIRSVYIQPAEPTQDMFYMTNGSYVWGITIQNYTSTGFSYNPNGETCSVYGSVFNSPYIQNVSSYTTIPFLYITSATSTTGQFSAPSAQTGPWPAIGDKVLITGQLTGTATINGYISNTVYYVVASTPGETFTLSETSNGAPITTTAGTTDGLTFSYYVFGGLCVSIDGNLVDQYSTKAMILGFITILNQNGTGLYLANEGYSQAVNIYTLYCDTGVRVESGSFITLNACDSGVGNYGLIADGVGSLQTSGKTVGTSTAGSFIINNLTNGQPFVNTVMQIEGDPTYYTIDTIIPIDALTSTVIIQQIFNTTVAPGTTVTFYIRSAIIASAHTFEYVGAGVTYAGLPQYGGIPIEENEVLQSNGGVVTFTSTDQKGNFKVGSGFVINQATGTITGNDFYESLFAEMTPFILALGSD